MNKTNKRNLEMSPTNLVRSTSEELAISGNAEKIITNIYLSVLLIFTFFSALTWAFILHETKLAIALSHIVANIIPSLYETGAISKNRNYAQFVLAVSWCSIPFTLALIFWCVDLRSASQKWRSYRDNLPNQRKWFFLAMAMGFVLVITLGILYAIPSSSGGQIDRAVFYGIHESNIFLVIYGCGLWATGSAMLTSITFVAYAEFFCKPKVKKGAIKYLINIS